MAPQHGDYDPQQQKWFCKYWMSSEEWFDVHDYSPPNSSEKEAANDSPDYDEE